MWTLSNTLLQEIGNSFLHESTFTQVFTEIASRTLICFLTVICNAIQEVQWSPENILKALCRKKAVYRLKHFLQFDESYSSDCQGCQVKEHCAETVSWRSNRADECTDTHQYVNTECTKRLRKHHRETAKKHRTESDLMICELPINYILSTWSWISMQSRHHNNTHLEDRSLVKKDAFRAKSSINFKSSSSIMSSGRASSSSSCFSSVLQDDVHKLRSCTCSQTWKPSPAYTCETILHFTCTCSSSTFRHVYWVSPENCSFIVTSNNNQSKHISTIFSCQVLLPEWMHFIFFIAPHFFPLKQEQLFLHRRWNVFFLTS